MKESKANLPKGWTRANLGELLELKYGKGLPEKQRDTLGKVPVYGSNGIVGYHSSFVTKAPCIIVGRKGSAGRVHFSKVPLWPIDTTYYVEPSDALNPLFVFHLLTSLNLGSLDKSTAVPGLNRDDAYSLNVLLPPLPEQHRIVNKIEELFTKLDAGVDALKKAKAQLKLYRQAVLKAAFEGKLTEKWRRANNALLEPVSLSTGKRKRTVWRSPVVDTAHFSVLPENWVYLSIADLAANEANSVKRGPFGSAIKKAFFVPSGYKVYEQKNVIYNNFALGTYYIDYKKYQELEAFRIEPGDILMSCSGTVGKVAIVPDDAQEGVINQALLKLTVNNHFVTTRFFADLFRFKIAQILAQSTRGTAMANISSVKDLKTIPFPIPPLPEQNRIIDELDRCFSVLDALEKAIDVGFKQSDAQRSAILRDAFTGEIVPQDPTDEPASKLLERIKAVKARELQSKPKKVTSKSRNQRNKGAQ